MAQAHAADPAKILRITFQAAETGFDPVRVSDYYSGTVIEAIFDPLLTYDYLARPAKLVPNTAEALPEISDQRPDLHAQREARHLLRRRSGVQGREARADRADYAYSIKRFLDPKNRSPYAFLFEGIAKLETPDRYTLRIRLKNPDFNFSPRARVLARRARSRAR